MPTFWLSVSGYTRNKLCRLSLKSLKVWDSPEYCGSHSAPGGIIGQKQMLSGGGYYQQHGAGPLTCDVMSSRRNRNSSCYHTELQDRNVDLGWIEGGWRSQQRGGARLESSDTHRTGPSPTSGQHVSEIAVSFIRTSEKHINIPILSQEMIKLPSKSTGIYTISP
ncbi:uncharacterized protein ACNLHF_016883 [Anomaloglossus baeobatrachus]